MSELLYHQPNKPFGKIMLRVILLQLEANAEKLRVEEQAGFGPGRSTVGQIFNRRVIIQKHLKTPVRSVP